MSVPDSASDRPLAAPITTTPAVAEPATKPHDPYAAWRFTGFRWFLFGNLTSVFGRQMTSVAVGWEVYRRTHSPTLLGLVGLFSALPLFFFTIPAGHLADRVSRKSIIVAAQAISILTCVGLALLSAWYIHIPAWPVLESGRKALIWVATHFDHNPSPTIDRGIVAMLALLTIAGVARTFGWAARTAFVPLLVPKDILSNAITWNSSTFQTASAIGPALGGIIIAKAGFPIVYSIDAFCALVFLLTLLPVRTVRQVASTLDSAHSAGTRDVLSGLRFVFQTKLVLSTMTLDLFAVLLGGATALLPVFADRLHVGPMGLGWLRAADSIGSIGMGILIAHLPPMKQAGKTLLLAVAAYGLAIIGFGLSPYFWLSLLMLFLTGVFDSLNVVIRHTLVQLMTPDLLRGRVSAVTNIFIGTSNELGAFESGLTAGLFGPIASVVGGGVGTLLVVATVGWIFPELRRFRSLRDSCASIPSSPTTGQGSSSVLVKL